MSITIALSADALETAREDLLAAAPGADLVSVDLDGRPFRGSAKVTAAALGVDYFWLTPDLFDTGGFEGAVDLALQCARVGVLETPSAGLDRPCYRQLASRGTRIVNSAAQGPAMAEHVMGQVLAAFQRHAERAAAQHARDWVPMQFREVAGTEWLLVGFGPICKGVAARARAFGATLTAVRRSGAPDPLVDRVGTMADLPALLPQADVVVLACPLNAQTRGLADAAFFGAMKPGSVLVNVGRGALVDEAALLAGLDAGRPGFAALDVFAAEPLPVESPFWRRADVSVTPHDSWNADGVRARWRADSLANIARFVRGEPIPREVDAATL